MPPTKWQRRRIALLAGVAALATLFGYLVDGSHILRRLEQQTVDARFAIRGTEPSRAAGVVLVEIDEATFDYLRNRGLHARWPFPRRYDARVIDALHRAGAGVIAVDLQLTEPSRRLDDNALIEAIGRAGNVVLSTTEVGPGGAPPCSAANRHWGARGAAANTSMIPDSDGVLREMQHSINGLKTFPVAVAEAKSGDAVPRPSSAAPKSRC